MRRCQRTRAVVLGLMGLVGLFYLRGPFAPRLGEREAVEGAPEGRTERAASSTRPQRAPAARAARAPVTAASAPVANRTAVSPSLPAWLDERIEVDPRAPLYVNDRPHPPGAREQLDPRHLAALQDIIDANELDEASSDRDYDDGDGVLEALELGFQVWSRGELVVLAFGPDPYWTFDYRLSELPASLGDLHRLQYLDLHSNALTSLPYELGDLHQLKELRAHTNSLTELPASFVRLESLRGAHLGRNALAGLPESFDRLENLEWLQLDDNPLVELPHNFGYLPALRVLGLVNADGLASAGGGLSGLPELLDDLTSLDALFVSGNRFGCTDGRRPELLVDGKATRVYGLSAQRCVQ